MLLKYIIIKTEKNYPTRTTNSGLIPRASLKVSNCYNINKLYWHREISKCDWKC